MLVYEANHGKRVGPSQTDLCMDVINEGGEIYGVVLSAMPGSGRGRGAHHIRPDASYTAAASG